MLCVDSRQPSSLMANRYMHSLSHTGGLFDSSDLPPEPPDFLDLDPDLLSTLSSPHSVDQESYDGTNSDIAMMDNWQMTEVFQDLPALDDDAIMSPPTEETAIDFDLIEKNLLPDDMATEPVEWKGMETVEFSAEDLIAVDLDLKTVIDEAFGGEGLQGYDLLEELEALERASSTSTTDRTTSVTVADCSAVESDHQYTQLSKLEVKPHETKKQAIRRVKNNAASKVCRKQRKNKFAANVLKVEELTTANNELKATIDRVQSLVNVLKDHLVKATCKK